MFSKSVRFHAFPLKPTTTKHLLVQFTLLEFSPKNQTKPWNSISKLCFNPQEHKFNLKVQKKKERLDKYLLRKLEILIPGNTINLQSSAFFYILAFAAANFCPFFNPYPPCSYSMSCQLPSILA